MLLGNQPCLRRSKRGRNSPARTCCQPIEWKGLATTASEPGFHFHRIKELVSWTEFAIEQFGNFSGCTGFPDLVQRANDEVIEFLICILGPIQHSSTFSHRFTVTGFCKTSRAHRLGQTGQRRPVSGSGS